MSRVRRSAVSSSRSPLARARVLLVAGALSLAACASDDAASDSTVSDTLAPPSTTVVTTTTLAPTTDAPTTTVAAVTTTAVATTTTAAATTTTEAVTTTTEPPAGAALTLDDDGIGETTFGNDPDEVILYVNRLVGDPDEDTGWVDALSRTCPGTEVRSVRWDDLTLLFGDDSSVDSGRRHFFAWSFGPATEVQASPAGVATAEGISIGSTVADIGRAYPSASLFEGDELSTASAHINDNLFAFITSTDDGGVVTAMLGGQGCGE